MSERQQKRKYKKGKTRRRYSLDDIKDKSILKWYQRKYILLLFSNIFYFYFQIYFRVKQLKD
ncbi:transmembrane protein, putative (macronuclear) [Tetrahymena thermophila SB210]|uniref:Transmembrane protein, putative n=1 Tax=Tetrahymena thermophila (strain SB210) TaxID=312017 RepID=W7XL69_TETTS|nr:transmembrane protein, putative [Tetrahymena thermophila SB210]EWS75769.1 transmembrane protein, putative [Tetrahymena thermophila SB210]|eukprot:XP_012651691.1 transmembrane protein, putative [Tetrahymena thermophila SB210]